MVHLQNHRLGSARLASACSGAAALAFQISKVMSAKLFPSGQRRLLSGSVLAVYTMTDLTLLTGATRDNSSAVATA